MKTSIKLCGFKYIEDITFATSLDINYLGMIFVQNVKRTVNLDTASQAVQICKDRGVKSVGVFLNQDLSEIENVLNKVDLDMLQLHGTENIEDYRVFRKDIIKTLHASQDLPLKVKDLDFDNVNYLIDTSKEDHLQGGTGKCFDWRILKDIPVEKLFVAGGLKPDNIIDLLSTYNPKCVDVSSGIEKEPGYKDHNLMSDFVQKIRAFQ